MVASHLELAQEFFERLASQATLSQELSRFNRKVLFRVLDGEDFAVEIHGGKVSFTAGSFAEPDMEMEADKETFTRLFQGEVSPGAAWAEAKLWLGGPHEGWSDTSKPDYPWLTRLIFRNQHLH